MDAIDDSPTPSSGSIPVPSSGVAYDVVAGIFIAIFLVGIIGNSIVIYVLFRKRRSWNITTTYLFNLAIADAVFVCTLPLWAQQYINRLRWDFGLFLCKFAGIASSVNMYASIFFLTAMSVDRWVAVVHATTINTARSSVVARVMCVVVWLSAAIFSIPRMIYQILDARAADNNVTSVTTLSPNVTAETLSSIVSDDVPVSCTFSFPKSDSKEFLEGLQEFVKAIIGFVIPMIVICVCYLRIVRTVRLKLISRRVKKERVAILAAVIVAAFFVCWLPLQIMTLYSAIAGWWNAFPFNEEFYEKVYPFCVCLAYANSCVNPFVYAFTATNFKNNVKEVCGSNVAACKDTKAYKMTLAREEHRTPLSPETKKTQLRGTSDKRNEKDRFVDEQAESSSDDVYEKLNPVNNREPREGNLGARGPPECRHLAVEDTTSGIYYEYYSSPPVVHHGPEVRVRPTTTKADIINHNNHVDKARPTAQSNGILEN